MRRMARFVLTLVGVDRAGLVATVADIVSAHRGNWERSQLAELGGSFAGIVEITAPDDRAGDLREALECLDGLATITVPADSGGASEDADAPATLTLTVLGNDRPGIVRDVTAALVVHELNIDRMTTEVRDAAMSGGSLFEASVIAQVPRGVDLGALRADLERIAAEIQVDIALSA